MHVLDARRIICPLNVERGEVEEGEESEAGKDCQRRRPVAGFTVVTGDIVFI
jgi:hypothetical protein